MNSGVRFQMLSNDQLEELFWGVLHLLEHTGLDVKHEEARDILGQAGAWVDGERVRVPSYLVKESLRMAPRSFTLYARDGNPKHDIHIGPGRAHFGPGPTCPNFIDIETMERRPYVKSDVPVVAKVVDALPNIDFCESLGTVSDVHHELGALYEFAGMFPNTSKPIVAWSYDRFDSAGIHEIAIAEAGGQEAFEQYAVKVAGVIGNNDAGLVRQVIEAHEIRTNAGQQKGGACRARDEPSPTLEAGHH
jgi:trimethylamine--corrinoid protein Co-methyltransferase